MTDKPDRFISIPELASMLGVDVKAIKKGKHGTRELPQIKLGSRVLFSLNTVQKWMEEKKGTKDEPTKIEDDKDHQAQ